MILNHKNKKLFFTDSLILQELENKRYIMSYLFKYFVNTATSRYSVQIEILTEFLWLFLITKGAATLRIFQSKDAY